MLHIAFCLGVSAISVSVVLNVILMLVQVDDHVASLMELLPLINKFRLQGLQLFVSVSTWHDIQALFDFEQSDNFVLQLSPAAVLLLQLAV